MHVWLVWLAGLAYILLLLIGLFRCCIGLAGGHSNLTVVE